MIIKELSNKQLVKGYNKVRNAFIKCDLLGRPDEATGTILDMFWNEITNRRLNLINNN